MDQTQAPPDPSTEHLARPVDDAEDVARVAQLVARAGLRLSTAEIAQLVAEYRYDRVGLDRMRTMLVPEDETAHAFRADRVMRRAGDIDQATEGGRAGHGNGAGDSDGAGDINAEAD